MKKKKKIALFIPTLDGGGAQRVALNLAEGFVKKGLKVDLILIRREGSLAKEIPEEVNVINFNKSRTLFGIPQLTCCLFKTNYDMLISFMNYVNICAIIASLLTFKKTKTIVTEHSTISRNVFSGMPLSIKFKHFLIKKLYPLADSVVAVSKGAADDLKQTIGLNGKVSVIYNPIVNNKLFTNMKVEPSHPWFCRDEPVILSVGRLIPLKNYKCLLKAFAKVNREINSRLIILGEGKERSELEELTDHLQIGNRVDMPGFRDNVYPFMVAADLFVLSSNSEALPSVLIEALACGTPIVSTDCPHGPSEVLQRGKYGRLVPVNDYKMLARAIKSSLQQPVCSVEDRKKRANIFSIDRIIGEYLKLL